VAQNHGPFGTSLQNFQPISPPVTVRHGDVPPEFMITARGCAPRAGFLARRRNGADFRRFRHAECCWCAGMEKDSHPVFGGVNFSYRPAKPATVDRGGSTGRGGRGIATSDHERGRDQGAARNGYRKRTRVRVACGGAIRPRGVGTHASHGHFGRSVVGSSFFPPVVLRSERRRQPCGRHLPRGARLSAAALTTPRHPGLMWTSAPADRIAQATRPGFPVVNRATSVPAPTVGTSRGWRRRTRPDPRKRLRPV
jgi:hypothetical protein